MRASVCWASSSGRASESVTFRESGTAGTVRTYSFAQASAPTVTSGAGDSAPHVLHRSAALTGTHADWNALSTAPFSSARSETRSWRNSAESEGVRRSLPRASPTTSRKAAAPASSLASTKRRSARSRGPSSSVAGHTTLMTLRIACMEALT